MIDALMTVLWFLLCLFCCLCIHVRDERIAGLEHDNDRLRADMNDAYRFYHDSHERVGALLMENTRLLTELAYVRRGEVDIDAGELIDEVEAWLEGAA